MEGKPSATAMGTMDLAQYVMGRLGGPAYLKRARQVQNACDDLIELCRRQREAWLSMVRIRLGMLAALAGDWAMVAPLLVEPGQVDNLRDLNESLAPRLRLPPKRTISLGLLRRAVEDLAASVERFNGRWRGFVATLDLKPVNALREGYNRYYLLEKECAVRSPRVALRGFRPLEPLTHEELLRRFPLLSVVRARVSRHSSEEASCPS